MINAAITPGTHPKAVRMKTIKKDPHPLSKTAKGGNKIAKRKRQRLIIKQNRNLRNKNPFPEGSPD